jgi:sulfide dehydrogenase cytochrome subunit
MHDKVRVAAFAFWAAAGMAQATDIAGLAATCHSCHGIDGASVGPSMPSIGGQNENYLKQVMLEQKHDKRYSSIMGRLLRTYSDEEIALMAQYFAAKPWVPAAVESEMRMVNRGRQLAQKTCQRCHGATGERIAEGTPRLAGQWPGYLAIESTKYTDPTFNRNKPSERMAERVCNLAAEDIQAVVHFLGTRK